VENGRPSKKTNGMEELEAISGTLKGGRRFQKVEKDEAPLPEKRDRNLSSSSSNSPVETALRDRIRANGWV